MTYFEADVADLVDALKRKTPTARECIEALPDTIKIGGFDFQLVRWNSNQAAGAARYGEFSSIEQIIRLQLGMPSRFKAVDTLLHEITHGIFWVYNIHDDDKEERVTGTMGSAWTQIHRDNPWLPLWLSECLT